MCPDHPRQIPLEKLYVMESAISQLVNAKSLFLEKVDSENQMSYIRTIIIYPENRVQSLQYLAIKVTAE